MEENTINEEIIIDSSEEALAQNENMEDTIIETIEDTENNIQDSSNDNIGEPIKQKSDEELKVEENIANYGFSANFDLTKLDKKSREILEDTDDSDYTFKLKDFAGPLDLLVHLIKLTKIDIRDIFISNITEQYLNLMKDIDSVDVEKASEFINMATTLLELKSKHLLPKDPVYEEEDTSEEDFFRMVEEYKLIKDEMDKLAEIETVDRFYKLPDSTVGEFRYELPESLSVDALIKSFSNLMQKMAVKAVAVQEKKIQKDRFTVAQKIAQIKDALIEKKEFKFTDMFEEGYSKSEIINTFLALLELLKRQYITVRQNALFDEIDIIRNDDIKERLTEEDIGSEYDGEN